MIPFVEAETIRLGSLQLSSFRVLLAAACVAGCAVAAWRGSREKLPVRRVEELCLWALVGSVAGARLGVWIYRPELWGILRDQPSLLLSGGISSFGGFAGGLAALAAFFALRRVSGVERWIYADAVAFALPFGGMLGRLGCTLAHDHPGLRSTNWLAVRYPDAPRWDLGFLEFLFLIALSCSFLLLGRRQRRAGFYLGVFFVLYGILRLVLDQLRVDPVRYWWFTVDQYAATLAIALGAWALATLARRPVC